MKVGMNVGMSKYWIILSALIPNLIKPWKYFMKKTDIKKQLCNTFKTKAVLETKEKESE